MKEFHISVKKVYFLCMMWFVFPSKIYSRTEFFNFWVLKYIDFQLNRTDFLAIVRN